ncbi:MAG: sn-glycerol-3-phosphate ABC transporter ATP-binding protein UgpC [Proteobacteria bacterium]|nr:sn-glycerol-3-phosphate ABC transporter ATP-binding protein UgpC [Pseudomonadota bacterium]
MSFLEIRGLYKQFASLDILNGIDIAVARGEFLVLVGPSGCGKSTLLNIIAGLEQATRGDIVIDGSRVNELHPSRRDIAMVFQSYALYPNMTVAQNMSFGMEMRKVPRAERERALAEVASTLQIEHLLDRKPRQLSGGQRQRVAMGRALVRKPRVFLFDEPLSNLDAKLRVDMRTEIKRLHQSLQTTVVYVTHDQVEAMTLATRIAVMQGGTIQQFGSPGQIYHEPANLFVAGFMGSPSMNLFPVTIEGPSSSTDDGSGRGVFVRVHRSSGPPLRLRLAERTVKAAAQHLGRTAILGLRPEAITDDNGADRSSAAISRALCRIDVVEPTGSDTFVVTILGGKEVIARLHADSNLAPGMQAMLAFHMEKAILFDPDSQMRIA